MKYYFTLFQEYPIFFSVVLGFSNGLFGSVPMIMAPSRVSREHREIAGLNIDLLYNCVENSILTDSVGCSVTLYHVVYWFSDRWHLKR